VLNKKQSDEQTKDQHVKELECALEEALVEREQILLACEKEIEQERNIAIELEQKMMEDFEWKLREVEGGYKTNIKGLEESLESKVTAAEIFGHPGNMPVLSPCPVFSFSCTLPCLQRDLFVIKSPALLYRSITTRGRSQGRRTQS
jgi:hypothetical protein